MISVSTSQFHLVKTAGNVRHQKKDVKNEKEGRRAATSLKGLPDSATVSFLYCTKTHSHSRWKTDRQTDCAAQNSEDCKLHWWEDSMSWVVIARVKGKKRWAAASAPVLTREIAWLELNEHCLETSYKVSKWFGVEGMEQLEGMYWRVSAAKFVCQWANGGAGAWG